jgi:hypothetical protein
VAAEAIATCPQLCVGTYVDNQTPRERHKYMLHILQAYEARKQEVDTRAQQERQALAIAKAILLDPDARAAHIVQCRWVPTMHTFKHIAQQIYTQLQSKIVVG